MKKAIDILSWIGNRIGKPPGWERLVRIVASPEMCAGMSEICVARDGVVFLAQPSVLVGWHVAFFGSYEPELREIFRSILRPGRVAFDVGANVGWHTLLMANLVGENGRVLAFEANPSVCDRLHENLNINHFRQVEVVPYAVADFEGTVEFHGPESDDASSGSGHIITNGGKVDQNIIRVETRRLDSVASTARIERLDLIKIDVEGFEWPVLRGGQQTIAKFRPHIIFEYNAEYVSRSGTDPKAIAEFFRTHRYRLFAIKRTWAELIELSNWPACADIWAVPLR